MNYERAASIVQYRKRCLVTNKPHDWRHATDAPGWEVGDECVRCQDCQLKAICWDKSATIDRNTKP